MILGPCRSPKKCATKKVTIKLTKVSDTYLEPSETSMMAFFFENS